MDTRDSQAHLTPLSVRLKELEDKGYKQQFVYANGSLKDQDGNQYQATDLIIAEEYRFEGESAPEDMSILYAVESNSGTKGTVVAPYGTYIDELSEFMVDVEAKDEAGSAH
jgi:hypothetical protein